MPEPPPLPPLPPIDELPAAWAEWIRPRARSERELVYGWAAQVAALVREAAGERTPVFDDSFDGEVEMDYFAMLNDRDLLEVELDQLSPDAADPLRRWTEQFPDAAFKEATVEDLALAERLWDPPEHPYGTGWWWSRLPRAGWMKAALERWPTDRPGVE